MEATQIAKTTMTDVQPDFTSLEAAGYVVHDIHFDGYFDGFSAIKNINGKKVEIYVGSDDGHAYFAPQAFVDGLHLGSAATPAKAARMAEFRAMLRGAQQRAHA